MSIVTYAKGDSCSNNTGQVILPYAHCVQFSMDSVYDDSSTDRILTRVNLMVQMTVCTSYLSMLAPDLYNNGNPNGLLTTADVMNVIYNRLMRQRRTLSVVSNGVELIPQSQAGLSNKEGNSTVDAKNGPQPQGCQIVRLTNESYLLTWHVIAHYWANNQVNPNISPAVTNEPGNNVLYNRWTESVSLNFCGMTTRRRNGKFVIRSDNFSGSIADACREQMCVLGVPPSFLRTSAHYTVDPSGLGISYELEDVEQYIMPPVPAYRADGKFQLSSSVAGLAVQYIQADLTLYGCKPSRGNLGGEQNVLLSTAIAVVALKLASVSQGGSPAGMIPVSASIDVDMYQNIVSFHMRAFRSPPPDTKKGSFLGFADPQSASAALVKTPTPVPNAGQTPPVYLLRGSANWLLHAANYWDPSITRAVFNSQTGQVSVGGEPGTAGRFGG